MDIVSGVLGVLGFVISLVTLGLVLWDRRQRIAIANEKLYGIDEPTMPYLMFFLDCTVINRSPTPVSITGGNLCVCGVQGNLETNSVLFGRYRVKGQQLAGLYSTVFPIALGPYEARSCIMCCIQGRPRPESNSPLYAPLRAVCLAEMGQMQSQPYTHQEFLPRVDGVVRLYTSRKGQRIRVHPALEHPGRRLQREQKAAL